MNQQQKFQELKKSYQKDMVSCELSLVFLVIVIEFYRVDNQVMVFLQILVFATVVI